MNIRQIFKLKIFFLGLFLFFITYRPCFAQTPDCDSALKNCHAYCDDKNVKIYDRERWAYVQQSDFAQYCDRSCNEGFKSCQTQDTFSSCGTFFFHCTGSCPWTIHDTYSGVSYEISETNAFNVCQQACAAGGKSCQQTSTPPRNRSTEFDACKEAQTSCYSTCMESSDPTYSPGNFPDLCAKACSDGVAQCQNEKGGKVLDSCYEYYYGCTENCPDVQIDDYEEASPTSGYGKRCIDSCQGGETFCKNMLHLLPNQQEKKSK